MAQGKPVASAGELVVQNGKLIEVSNRSGHYAPSQGMNDQLMHELKERGLSNIEQKNILRSGFDYEGNDVFTDFQSLGSIEEKPVDYIPDEWWK